MQCQQIENNNHILLNRAETGIIQIVFKALLYHIRAVSYRCST